MRYFILFYFILSSLTERSMARITFRLSGLCCVFLFSLPQRKTCTLKDKC